jgi:hypothetical protein
MKRLYILGIGTMATGHDEPFSEGLGMLEKLPINEHVSPKQSRRFGRLTKMIYIAAKRAIESAGVSDSTSLPIINATCIGETRAGLGILEQIHQTRGKTISPALVPNSVHNSPAGYLSIGLENRAPSITVSQGWVSSEAAVAAASDWVDTGVSDTVLVLSGDEADPAWVAKLRDFGASSLAAVLEKEAFQEGAVAMVLSASGGDSDLGSVVAGVERRNFDPRSLSDLFNKYRIEAGENAEVRVRRSAGADRLRPVLAEVLHRPVESILVDGQGRGTAQAYALNALASAARGTAPDELLLVGGEIDDVAFLHWVRNR